MSSGAQTYSKQQDAKLNSIGNEETQGFSTLGSKRSLGMRRKGKDTQVLMAPQWGQGLALFPESSGCFSNPMGSFL